MVTAKMDTPAPSMRLLEPLLQKNDPQDSKYLALKIESSSEMVFA
jgi:hypothetical protein